MTPRPAGGRIGLSVVLPAHNEITLLRNTVIEITDGLSERGLSFEIVIVENGSADGTHQLACLLAEEVPQVRVLTLPRGDYGDALATGFESACGDLVVFFDVDYYDLVFLDKALALIDKEGAAIVVASKRAPGSSDQRPMVRRLATLAFTSLLRAALDLPVSDSHGMKILRRDTVAPIVSLCELRESLFDVELVIRTAQAGHLVLELPVTVVERRPPRSSLVRRSVQAVRDVVRLRRLLRSEASTGQI